MCPGESIIDDDLCVVEREAHLDRSEHQTVDEDCRVGYVKNEVPRRNAIENELMAGSAHGGDEVWCERM